MQGDRGARLGLGGRNELASCMLLLTLSPVLSSLLYLVVIGLIAYVCWWGWHQIALPEPFFKIGKIILVVAIVLVLADFLLSLIGHSFIGWR